MLKRKGQVAESIVLDSTVRLTRRQLNAYATAFAAIQTEFDELQQMQRQVDKLPQTTLEQPAGSSNSIVTISADGIKWQTQTQLLKLPKSTILLCRQSEGNECAIVQQFSPQSAYAKANGQHEILLRSADPRQLLCEYAGWAQHTLRFMASNLVAQAQRVAFEQFPQHNPGRVMRAISERCLRAVGQSVTESLGQPPRQARGVRM